MAATLKSTREPPQRNFSEYVLTLETSSGAGLFPVSNSMMQPIMSEGSYGSSGYSANWPAGAQGALAGNSYVKIGFTFTFDHIAYSTILVDLSGCVVLLDPDADLTSFDHNGAFINSTTISLGNNDLLDSFVGNHVVLAPWWGYNTCNTWKDMNGSWLYDIVPTTYTYTPGDYFDAIGLCPYANWQSSQAVSKIRNGMALPPIGIDDTIGGCKIYRTSTSAGKCIVIRWKNFTDFGDPFNIIMYDLVLYESGFIEFRYMPRSQQSTFLKTITETSVCGIFAFGGSLNNPRYRDFSPILTRNDSRPMHPCGGATYDGAYTDPIRGTKYFSSLNAPDHWPGQRLSGAIFRFSPPVNRRRQNRSILPLRDSVSFSNFDTSYFDDQNTISFVTQSIEYPAMLPTSYKTTSNSSNVPSILELYQSGSITVRKVIKPGMFDSLLNDSKIESNKRFGK